MLYIIYSGGNLMKIWLLAILIFSEGLFFGTRSLLNLEYIEGSSSNYGSFNLFLGCCVIILVIAHLVKRLKNKNNDILVSNVVVGILVFLIFIGLVVSLWRYDFSTFAIDQLLYFLGFTIPAVILGTMIKEQDILNVFQKIKYINVYLTICFLSALIKSSGGNISMFHEIGGASHLTIGYTMSALFTFNIISLMNGKRFFGKLFYLILILINIAIILFSGSRGALVSVSVIALISVVSYVIKKRKIFTALLLSVIIGLTLPLISKNQNFSFAIDRIISGFSSGGDNSTNQRKMFYNTAIDNFYSSPLFGNGIGSYSKHFETYSYPHNIILEIMNDFGLIGLIISIIFLFLLFKKVRWILKHDYRLHLIVFLFLNVIVQLLFSGSYLVSSQFWILSTIILAFRRKEYYKLSGKSSVNLLTNGMPREVS